MYPFDFLCSFSSGNNRMRKKRNTNSGKLAVMQLKFLEEKGII